MISRKNAGARGFWDWLADNTARVQAGLKRDADRMAEEIGSQFEKSYPGLVWEVSLPERNGPWVFCVSANGNRKLFPRVRKVVQEAPKLKGWKIQAFRPRGNPDTKIELKGQTLDCDDIWCEVKPIRRGVSLVMHIRGVTLETEEVLSNAALILLDNAIGEYDTVMKIADLDIALMEGNPKVSRSFFPLRDLPAFLDRIHDAS